MKQDSKIADGVLCDVIHGVYQGAPPPLQISYGFTVHV